MAATKERARPKPNTIGATVRQLRKAAGLTQEELAGRVGDGMTQGDVSGLELGNVGTPRRPRLERIAAALRVSTGELLARSGWSDAESYFRAAEYEQREPPMDDAATRKAMHDIVDKLPSSRLWYAHRNLRNALNDREDW